ncbi:MAG: hypothetical protein KGN38_11345 [Actinomycetales bacterium]|nr:hypothetical protein [Actinomycetales bacterium]
MIRRWFGRAFGSASVSVTSMLLVAPLGFLLAVALGPQGAGRVPAVWLWAAASQAVFTVTAFGLPRLLRARHPLTRAACVALGGVLRGLTMSWAFVSLGLVSASPSDTAFRAVHSAVACTLWVGFCGVLLQGGVDFRASYRRLMAQSMTLQRIADSDDVPVELVERWNAIERRVNDTVESARTLLSTPDVMGSDLQAAAEVIASGVNDDLRSETHNLWRSADLEPPRLKWKELLVAILDPWAPPVLLILEVFASLMFLGTLSRSGIGIAALFTVTLTVGIATILLVSRAIARRVAQRQVLVGAVTLVVMPFLLFAMATTLGQGVLNVPEDRAGLAVACVSAALVCWTVLIYQRLANERALLLASLRARLDDQMIRLMAGRRTGVWEAQLGAYVHHSVSSEMTALHLHLRQAADAEADPAQRRRARQSAEQRLLGLQSVSPPWVSRPAGRERIVQVAESWQGIAEVAVELEPEALRRPDQWQLAALVVEEAVAGAVRSGGARHVTVTAKSQGEELIVAIEDDGRGVPADATPGLGTAWLDLNFGSTWSRGATVNGTRLQVSIG